MNYDETGVVYLTSCPFCGEFNTIRVRYDDTGYYCYAQCDKCLARGPLAGSVTAAANKWNEQKARSAHHLIQGTITPAEAKDVAF